MLTHLAIALLIQSSVKKLLRTSWLAGAAAAASWAISREIAQAEYRWIEWYGERLRENMPWWGPFDPRVWHADALVDWLAPTLMVGALAYWLDRRSGNKTKGEN